jgi:3-hydroxyacyl-CoA dehydrogenase / enoyl-CoA hydratase / 3-hydroxybutyryl-CoA epimerase
MQSFSVKFHEQFAYVNFDMPNEKVNKFNRESMAELSDVVDQLEKRTGLEWVLFDSNKSGVFIAGADIKELNNIQTEAEGEALIARGQQLFLRISKLKPRTVALVDGVALGGGLEFALSCDFIVVTDSDKVKLGLPEVNLGIIPGWGGTQRLPRRIGLIQGIQHIVAGKVVDGKRALKLGLADAMVPNAFKHQALMDLIRAKKLKRRPAKRGLIERIPFLRFIIYRKAKASILNKTQHHYPAPIKALDVIKSSYGGSVKKGLEIEFKGVTDLFSSSIPKHLTNLFFAQEHLKKAGKAQPMSGRSIQQVGICGAGLMGGGIGWWFLDGGSSVRFKDISWDMVRQGYNAAFKVIQKGVKVKKVPAFKAPLLMDHVSSTLEYNGFEGMDLVVEAVPENLELKRSVFKDLEAAVSDTTIIASNTSSLSIDDMAQSLQHPERFLGIHFFSPVQKMPLVEVIPSERTDPKVVGDVCNMVLKNKKFPVIVKNCPGFLINRILLPYVNEAVQLVLQGFKVDDIDKIATDFGMPLGPLALADEVGLDVGYKVLNILYEGYGERMAIPHTFRTIVEEDQILGKKSGLGFYRYSGDTASVNLELYKQHSIVVKQRISDQDQTEILDRLILIMVNEAARCIQESIVESAEVLDLAMIMGTGFPPFRGGLLRYADERGVADIVLRLNQLAQSVDQRFKPSDYLVKLSQDNGTFYR